MRQNFDTPGRPVHFTLDRQISPVLWRKSKLCSLWIIYNTVLFIFEIEMFLFSSIPRDYISLQAPCQIFVSRAAWLESLIPRSFASDVQIHFIRLNRISCSSFRHRLKGFQMFRFVNWNNFFGVNLPKLSWIKVFIASIHQYGICPHWRPRFPAEETASNRSESQ
jgi:hypothetical protein